MVVNGIFEGIVCCPLHINSIGVARLRLNVGWKVPYRLASNFLNYGHFVLNPLFGAWVVWEFWCLNDYLFLPFIGLGFQVDLMSLYSEVSPLLNVLIFLLFAGLRLRNFIVFGCIALNSLHYFDVGSSRLFVELCNFELNILLDEVFEVLDEVLLGCEIPSKDPRILEGIEDFSNVQQHIQQVLLQPVLHVTRNSLQ